MPTGSKAKYTDKQKHQAEHIEDSFEKRGMSKKTAAMRAWQTVKQANRRRREIGRRPQGQRRGQEGGAKGIRPASGTVAESWLSPRPEVANAT